MRQFFAAQGIVTLLLLVQRMVFAAGAPESEMSLAGSWRFEMDRKGVGMSEAWFKRELTGTIKLPGSMAENALGDAPRKITPDVATGKKRNLMMSPIPKRDYRGAAWFQKTVEISPAWEGKFIGLFLERVCWQSELWVDDKLVGLRDSLIAPHRYDLGSLSPGKHRLTLCINNRQHHAVGGNTHSYHEGSCTIYNGVIGKIALQARPAVFVRGNQVYADPVTGACELRVTVANQTGKPAECSLEATIKMEGSEEVLGQAKQTATLQPGETMIRLNVPVQKNAVKLWSEFDRPLYLAHVEAKTGSGADTHTARFGFRSFTTSGPQFLINGKPVLLRGEANNAQFPLTGYPPMTKAEWLKILGLFKNFGLNHFRCHAWTPPEAAFDAADELGIYLQPELPNSSNRYEDSSKNWRLAEFDRILETCGNHPSFVQMTMGNEAFTKHIDFLKGLVLRGREHDRRHLYASISNPHSSGIFNEVPGDDFAVAHQSGPAKRRMQYYFFNQTPETVGDYRATMAGRPVPQICHENGQWCVYPDLSEIERYTGVLRPLPLEQFRVLAKHEGVLPQARDFVNASGRFSLLLYKEEIERSLRTPQYGGFQLLGLQDSFDQGSAYVGQINNFFEPKSYVTAAMFREFCASQVPLARLAKRVWLNNETFAADIELANYGPGALKQKTVTWQLSDGERVVANGQFGPLDLPETGLQSVGRLQYPLGGITKAAKLQLLVSVTGTEIRNRWDIWVYPKACDTHAPSGVKVVNTLDPATIKQLRNGARVVLLPTGFVSPYPTSMTPPFWNPIHFPNQRQIFGLLCDPKHPALQGFPNDGHTDWQWYELVAQGAAMRMVDTPADYRPIVQGIDQPGRNHKLALVYETKVGKGSLLVCTLDLERDLEKRPVARQLRRSLLDYAASPDFHPTTEIALEKNNPADSRASVLPMLSPEADADSENENNDAMFAVDNNPDTIWQTRRDGTATPPPHRLTIRWKKAMGIKGFIQIPRQDNDQGRIAKYRIYVSRDGKGWNVVAEGNWPNSAEQQRVLLPKPLRTNFIRLEALSEVNNKPWISVAEFDVIPE